MLKLKLKIWIENARGQALLGDGRADLLQAINETGTLSAAAKQMKMSYRKAWNHLNEMEKVYGRKLVDRSIGGRTGGGCALTETGKNLLESYHQFRKELEKSSDKIFDKFFI